MNPIPATLTPDGNSVLLRFPYDAALIARVQLVPGRRWVKTLGGWTIPLTAAGLDEAQAIIQTPLMADAPLKARISGVEDFPLEVSTAPLSHLDDVEMFPATRPFAHHHVGIKLAMTRSSFAFFWEMGTMKTYLGLAIAAWQKRASGLPSLIIAPASVLHVWEDQAAVHQPGLRVVALTGSVAHRAAFLQNLAREQQDPGEVTCVVVNPEALAKLGPLLALIKWANLLVDESHRFKHHSAQQTRALMKLAPKIPRRYLFSGTPDSGNPLAYWSQFFLLDPAILGASFFACRNRYGIMGGFQGKAVIGFQKLDEFQKIIGAHCHRVTKAQCLDLPPKVYEVIRLDMEGEQKRAYHEMAAQLVTEVNGKEISVNVLPAKLMKLRQICTGFLYYDDETGKRQVQLKENAKKKALEDILLDLPAGAKIVVWGLFRPELDWVQALCEQLALPSVRLDGSTPLGARREINVDFQNNASIRVFIGQQQAGGIGIDLTAATYCVFLTNDFDPAVRMQAEDRLHRQGQKNTVTYYDLAIKGTVDVAVLGTQRKKQKLADLLSAANLGAVVAGQEI